MIHRYGEEGFNNDWLELIKHDPIHPKLKLLPRIKGNRTVFVYSHEGIPQFMVCARIGNKLPHNISEVLSDDGYNSAYDVKYGIFYSIFRLPGATLKGGGKHAIKELIEYCKIAGLNGFFTLSPIPFLRDTFSNKPNEAMIRNYLESLQGPVEKFHLGNGARIQNINFDADMSSLRYAESWGIMVNYDYNHYQDDDKLEEVN